MNNLLTKDAISDSISLSEYKQLRYGQVDIRTGELILQGFEYPVSSGKIFSFSENAQNNLLGTFAAKDLLGYPFPWNTKDDSESYGIADATEMATFFMTALASKKSHQDSGTAKKTQIRNAATRVAAEAVLDER